ncbi:MAG: hypothetical protein FWD66_07580 [Paludibacter sp.]|nr:hypothetical protein [Paludibacter sp.]
MALRGAGFTTARTSQQCKVTQNFGRDKPAISQNRPLAVSAFVLLLILLPVFQTTFFLFFFLVIKLL